MYNFLILINNGPSNPPYLVALGDELVKAGHKVSYAFTDRLPMITYDIKTVAEDTYIFSTFFKENYGNLTIDDKYGQLNLWGTYFCDFDRKVVNYGAKDKGYEYDLSLLANLVNFFDLIYKERNINYVIYENVSNSFAYLAFEVGRLNNVGYLGYCGSRLAGRFEIQTEVMNIVERYSQAYDTLRLEDESRERMIEIDAYIAKYSSDVVPSYHPVNHPASYNYSLVKKYLSSSKVKMVKAGIKFKQKYRDELHYSYQIDDPITHYSKLLIRQLKRRIKVQRLKSIFGKRVPGESYFILPLQMKPESSTSVWAKHFVDEVTLIKNIAFNLPYGTKLYVKEHFVNLGNHSMRTYNELKQIPNVRLIHPSEPNMALLKNSKGIITLTSTMGFEALVMGKKVVSFGDIFYQKHPACVNLRSFENLHEVLNSIHGDEQVDISVTRRFIAAYYKCTFEGNIDVSSYSGFERDKFVSVMMNGITKTIASLNTGAIPEK